MKADREPLFRALPAMDAALAAAVGEDALLEAAPRPLLRDALTAFWDAVRRDIREGRVHSVDEVTLEACLPRMLACARSAVAPRLRRVINATGVVIHTNMGRSVLAEEAVGALLTAAGGYCSLELDLRTGGRGSRHSLCEPLLCRLTGAEAALVVNNNAAAVLLLLDTFCKGGEVAVSRGELVEIGGGFRIPEVMARSGAVLREVGTTNRTHLRDYERAIGEQTRALMRVHTSNYRIVGFHAAVAPEELVALGRRHGVPVFEDVGSGSLTDFSAVGLPSEPTVQGLIAAGLDVVAFSGDKVLGGPQAGILAGRADMIARMRENPLTRALRCDKFSLAALEATLRLYGDPDLARRRIPTLRMLCMGPEALARAARALAHRLRRALGAVCAVRVRPDVSRVGGGAFPECDLPTSLVCLTPGEDAPLSAAGLRQALLATSPPLIGRLEGGAFCLDPRTLLPRDGADIAALLSALLRP